MHIHRNGQEISVSHIVNEKEVSNEGAQAIETEIKANSKREDFEDKTIFDQIDTDGDETISYEELDTFVTDIKKKADKNEALDKYIRNEREKGDTAGGIGFMTGLGLVFAGGAILGGAIGKFQGMRVGHVLKKLVTNVTAKKIISNSCKVLGAGLMGLGGGITSASFLGIPLGGILGFTAKDIFENTKSDDELKQDFESEYKAKEPDKSKEWEIFYDGKNANSAYPMTSFSLI